MNDPAGEFIGGMLVALICLLVFLAGRPRGGYIQWLRDCPLWAKANMEQVEIKVSVKRETERALLVDFGGKEEVWIPKSQITDWGPSDKDLAQADCIFIPDWLATAKGMV